MSTGNGRHSARSALTDGERLISIEITQDHQETQLRQVDWRLEAGDKRMDHIERRIRHIREEAAEEKRIAKTRETMKLELKESRKNAMNMVAWFLGIGMFAIALTNLAIQIQRSHQASAVTAPARD